MANYAVEKYSVQGDYPSVLAAIETKLETVDATKTIRMVTVVPYGNEVVGLVVYDT